MATKLPLLSLPYLPMTLSGQHPAHPLARTLLGACWLPDTHLPTSSKAALSSSGHMALSRSMRRPSDLRLHRCPPFLSAAVRSATSMMNALCELAK